ncbi:hypothetical protein, unlikely [Trypanosoma brucei gambiense DAL972]|uniref:Uncharacterized protein n=1 Tax=Trypanosoma brucei gambiense (strain MHOM/CI/86/DAL972) TaxID=679716 RepID=D0A463_TRYB9|nr:hypothetical protein, unlikely [Trypanosoma brucei gambiense DAL972]CBH16057.1 hypothetical protein, unlikely [Trypanosoma brucei gambiense DAL972]|eukprot:XP_011778321.1 hypothetical protein, unlikely [Trypanosoma brucei gambiense DAL972]
MCCLLHVVGSFPRASQQVYKQPVFNIKKKMNRKMEKSELTKRSTGDKVTPAHYYTDTTCGQSPHTQWVEQLCSAPEVPLMTISPAFQNRSKSNRFGGRECVALPAAS